MKLTHQTHSFPAFYDKDSAVLILGSFPSVKSREYNFYYMHPQNRFFKVLSDIYHEDFYHASIEEKKALLKKYHLALYDVLEECDIEGSSDASINNVKAADLNKIINESKIKLILINGKKAYNLFLKYQHVNVPFYGLPSTSPANAIMSKDDLVAVWKKYLT